MSEQKKKRVVVTGMGAVTALGNSMEATWNGIVEGQSVAGPVKRFDASQFPCNIAYEVKDFAMRDSVVATEDEFYLNRAGRFGVNAAVEALEQANLLNDSDTDAYRKAVCLGVGVGIGEFNWFRDLILEEKFDDPAIANSIREQPYALTAIVSRIMGAKGGSTSVHTACASSGQAAGEAYEMIAYGEQDIVLAGGADSMVQPYYFAGFCLLGALSQKMDDPKTASRPFDADRSGFILGEGACMFVLEELEHAKARGAQIFGEVVGYGVTESAYRITDLHPEGTGPKEAMEMATVDAGINPSQVGYINAHGTSTQLNDRIEALAVAKAFPQSDVRVSSTKSMTGHMISAAGAMELAVCMKALEHQVLPPSVNLFNPDPSIEVKLCETKVMDHKFEYALSNSVGFGGSNTAVIARRFTP